MPWFAVQFYLKTDDPLPENPLHIADWLRAALDKGCLLDSLRVKEDGE